MLDIRDIRVRDVMTASPQTVTVDTPIADAYAVLVGARLSGLPVVDGEGRVQGLFSLSDLASELQPVLHPESDGDPVALGAVKARQVGSRVEHLVIVGPDEPLVAACQRMVRGHARKVVVVEDERPIGVVSAVDVARAVAALGFGATDLAPDPTDLMAPVAERAPARPAFSASPAPAASRP